MRRPGHLRPPGRRELTAARRADPLPASAAELVRRIRAGDADAEGELVSRYHRGVMVLIRRATSDASAVDDLHQETFHIALEKIRRGELRDPERLSGFIGSLARNLVIAHHRRAAAHPSRGEEAAARTADPAPDPLENALRAESASIVRRVLGELPSDRDRQILLRFYIFEDEKDAICRDLELSSLHFNRVLFRARQRYRQLYEDAAKNLGTDPR